MSYRRLLISSLAAAMLGGVCSAEVDGKGDARSARKRPAIPRTPAPINKVLYVQAFTLEEPYRTDWRKGRPWVKAGYLLVLEVDPALVFPRQTAEPILYVGSQVAERINIGYRSGHVVAVVPGKAKLKEEPIWFGTPGLPEAVDDERIGKERAAAKAAKMKRARGKGPEQAFPLAADTLSAKDRRDLLRRAGELVLEYSPREETLGRRLARPKKSPDAGKPPTSAGGGK
ncbi:MAG: hypothetical protein HKN95_02875 [Acidimicrobiia bacterium]|nr:hypothetical protein [Acidimicrobiia bacterium]